MRSRTWRLTGFALRVAPAFALVFGNFFRDTSHLVPCRCPFFLTYWGVCLCKSGQSLVFSGNTAFQVSRGVEEAEAKFQALPARKSLEIHRFQLQLLSSSQAGEAIRVEDYRPPPPPFPSRRSMTPCAQAVRFEQRSGSRWHFDPHGPWPSSPGASYLHLHVQMDSPCQVDGRWNSRGAIL